MGTHVLGLSWVSTIWGTREAAEPRQRARCIGANQAAPSSEDRQAGWRRGDRVLSAPTVTVPERAPTQGNTVGRGWDSVLGQLSQDLFCDLSESPPHSRPWGLRVPSTESSPHSVLFSDPSRRPSRQVPPVHLALLILSSPDPSPPPMTSTATRRPGQRRTSSAICLCTPST